MVKKERLDVAMVQRGLAESRAKAQAIIMSGLMSRSITLRLDNLLNAIRGVREGSYNQRAVLSGHDEFTQIAGEFNALVDRLQETENARRQFVSDASHELKPPLASIKLLSDSVLQNDMDIDTVREFVGDIGNEADRLNRMSQKLLSLSRIETQADSDCEKEDGTSIINPQIFSATPTPADAITPRLFTIAAIARNDTLTRPS